MAAGGICPPDKPVFNEQMGRWLRGIFWLSLGLALGVGLGLFVGWVIEPAEFTNANPSVLQEDYRRDYALMIATAYAADNDLETAARRVDSLGENGRDFLFSLTLSMILAGEKETDIRYLAQLAADLGLSSPAIEPYLAPTPDPS